VTSEVDQLQIALFELQPSPVLMGCFPDSYLQSSNYEIRLAAILVCMRAKKKILVELGTLAELSIGCLKFNLQNCHRL